MLAYTNIKTSNLKALRSLSSELQVVNTLAPIDRGAGVVLHFPLERSTNQTNQQIMFYNFDAQMQAFLSQPRSG
jgi:hypothetical protein